MGFRSGLINLFYRVATGTRAVRRLLTPLGAGGFVILVTLLVLGSIQFDKLMLFPKLLSSPWHLVISIPLICFGLFMVGWSVFNFTRVKGTPVPFNPPPKLVDTGPYAITRNPMLTGVFSLLLGIGCLLRSMSLVCIFTPVFALLMALELKMIEEPELEKRLGEAYVGYKARTPMFFPMLKGWPRKKPGNEA